MDYSYLQKNSTSCQSFSLLNIYFMKSIIEYLNENDQLGQNVDEALINEGGIMSILKSMKNGDLIEVISAAVATEEFAKSSVKREIVDQLNKRNLLPDVIAKPVDTYYKYKPLYKKLF